MAIRSGRGFGLRPNFGKRAQARKKISSEWAARIVCEECGINLGETDSSNAKEIIQSICHECALQRLNHG